MDPSNKEQAGTRDPRIVKHIQALAACGSDMQKFGKAIEAVRDDPQLTRAMREAVWKTLAQEAMQAYVLQTTGKPLDQRAILKDTFLEQFENPTEEHVQAVEQYVDELEERLKNPKANDRT